MSWVERVNAVTHTLAPILPNDLFFLIAAYIRVPVEEQKENKIAELRRKNVTWPKGKYFPVGCDDDNVVKLLSRPINCSQMWCYTRKGYPIDNPIQWHYYRWLCHRLRYSRGKALQESMRLATYDYDGY